MMAIIVTVISYDGGDVMNACFELIKCKEVVITLVIMHHKC